MNSCQRVFSACLLALLTQAAFAQSAPQLGSASRFAVLSAAPNVGGAVTCTGGTITGDVGSSGARASVVQTEGCAIAGAIIAPVSAAVLADFNGAYDALAPRVGDICPVITGTLDGQILAPGVYCVSAEAKTGVLTLDGSSNANGTWTFKVSPIPSTPTPTGALTGTNFSVVMAGGASSCNVTWWVPEAATMTDSDFKGTLFAGAAITSTRGTFEGRALAKAAVTLTGPALVGCGAGQPGPGPGPGPGPSACSDRVTGGGYIQIGSGKHGKANFGVTGGISRKGKLRGHLTYIDHSAGFKVKGTGVTAYVEIDAKTRRVEGTATIGEVAVTYQVDVTDNGEPGRNDTFAITLSNGYSASGTLAGGNIQLHKRHCGKKKHSHHGHGDNDHDDDDDDGDGDHDDGKHNKRH